MVDIDGGKDSAREFFRTNKEIISTIVETFRGCHFLFSGETQQRKFPGGDIKSGENAYVVAPTSIVRGWKYRFVQNGILQPFSKIEHLFPIEKKETYTSGIRFADAYIKHIRAVSGQNGHNTTFRAVCRLRDAGYSEAEALAAIVEWNQTNSDPPWTVRELLHKVRSAYAKVLK